MWFDCIKEEVYIVPVGDVPHKEGTPLHRSRCVIYRKKEKT